MKLNEKYQRALDFFAEKYKRDPNVEAILLTGSVLHSIPDKNSDLDIYIVLKNSTTRERGNTWVEGVEIEYFINPIKQVYKYFEEESAKGKITTLHMFANNEVVFRNGEEIEKMIKFAQDKLSEKAPELSVNDIEMARYFIDDLRKDLLDAVDNEDEFSKSIVKFKIIDKCIETFMNVNRSWAEKPKRLFQQLKQINPEFAELVFNALKSSEPEATRKLCEYTEGLIGGPRPKEWKMISQCKF